MNCTIVVISTFPVIQNSPCGRIWCSFFDQRRNVICCWRRNMNHYISAVESQRKPQNCLTSFSLIRNPKWCIFLMFSLGETLFCRTCRVWNVCRPPNREAYRHSSKKGAAARGGGKLFTRRDGPTNKKGWGKELRGSLFRSLRSFSSLSSGDQVLTIASLPRWLDFRAARYQQKCLGKCHD
jgi:hypothetical protein